MQIADQREAFSTGMIVLAGADASPQTCIAASIRDIGRDAWNACFPHEVEDYDYLLAVEEAGMEEFRWRYITLFENGRLIAAMPMFLTKYQLETTVELKFLRRLTQRIRRYWPGYLSLKLACLGSPCTETGLPGFRADVPTVRRPALLAVLLRDFERYAESQGYALRAVKDVPETLGKALRRVIDEAGFAATPALPTAWLDVDFTSLEEYLGRLSAGTRKDMRRKLKSEEHIRVEMRTDFADFLPRVMTLYRQTRDRSDWQFEALTPKYFTGVLDNMPGRSLGFFYFAEETLLAANILVRGNDRLIDKFFCMDAAEGRKYNLYYLSWFNNVRFCLEEKIELYQSGQAYYENKLRLGSKLTANTMYFKHRNFVVQRLLGVLAPLLSFDQGTEQPS